MTELIRSSQFCEVKETTSASPVRVLMKVFICLLNYEDNGCVITISEKIMTVKTLQMGTMHLYFVIQPPLHWPECS
jgi:flavorubredoxin